MSDKKEASTLTPEEIAAAQKTLGELNAILPEHKQLKADVKNAQEVIAGLQTTLNELRSLRAEENTGRTVRRPGQISRKGAENLGARILVLGALSGGFTFKEEAQKAQLLKDASGFLGIQSKATLTSSDIPQMVEYMREVVEMIPEYGIGRLITTGIPLMADTVNLPRVGTKPAFGYIGAPAGTINEKSPTYSLVTFQAKKYGGIVRYPREIEQGSIVAFGEFISRYGAMEFARVEDDAIFNADGTTAYGPATSLVGFRTLVDVAATREVLAATKTSNMDVTVAALRGVRSRVASAALRRGAYYLHPSFESVLSALNEDGKPPVYRTTGAKTAEQMIGRSAAAVLADATLDGFPIVWVDVMPVASADANASQVFALFGDASFLYYGDRLSPEVNISEQAYWTTDEIGIRFLARHAFNSMVEQAANKAAMAGIKTAAA